MKHQAGGIRQRERPARVGGRDLSRTVSDHAVGMDAPGLEPLREGALQHEDHGLGKLYLVQFLLLGIETRVAQGAVRVLAPMLLDGVDNAAEHGIGLVEITPATRPLRALSGEHHEQPGRLFIHRG